MCCADLPLSIFERLSIDRRSTPIIIVLLFSTTPVSWKEGFCWVRIRKKARSFGSIAEETKFGKEYIFFGGRGAQLKCELRQFFGGILSTIGYAPTLFRGHSHFVPHFTLCVPHNAIPHFTNSRIRLTRETWRLVVLIGNAQYWYFRFFTFLDIYFSKCNVYLLGRSKAPSPDPTPICNDTN